MATTIRDLCPIHGVPMWYTPMDGTYACQRVQCGVTAPVNEHGSFKPEEDYVASSHYWTAANTPLQNHARMMAKTRWLYMTPTEFRFTGPFT